ncbi:hypothetical protein EAF04_001976 [Stromatinia cepivora]|nr:hypothetical protein EAF04_001976 [Stromatinia cepivora]
MPSQRVNGKAQQRNAKLQELKERREEAEKKRAHDLASKPAAKTAISTAKKSDNQALNSSPAKPVTMSSLPRINKVKGTSKAEKKAQEEAVAAAKKKREMAEKEEGEIDSDDDEVVFTGRMNNSNQNRNHAPANNTIKTKPPAPTTRRPPDKNKDQMKSCNNNNKARDIKKSQLEDPKSRGRRQNLQKPKESDVKTSSIKRKLFDSNDDSSSSGEEICKPAKKQKTTKAGMDFENPPTKRKHIEEEEEETRAPVKKQKITEEVKKPAIAPIKRAPVAKETKFRMDTNKNVFNFGAPKPSKKPAPIAKKGSMQSGDISEKLKGVGKKDAKTASSSTPSTGIPSELQCLPAASNAKRSQDLASNMAPQPTQSPPQTFTGISDRAKSRRRDAAAPSALETTPQSAASSLHSAATATTTPRNSRSSSVAKLMPVAKKVVNNRKKSDKPATAPQSSTAKKLQGTEVNMKEELKQDKVEVPKQPKPVVEVSRSLAVELDPEQDALLEKDIAEHMANLDPKVAAVVKAEQQEDRRFLRESKKPAVKLDRELVKNDGLNAFGDAQGTIKTPPSPSPMEDTGSEDLDIDLERAFEAERQLQLALEASLSSQTGNVPSSDQLSVDRADESPIKDGSAETENAAIQQGDLNVSNSSNKGTSNTITNATVTVSAPSSSAQIVTSVRVPNLVGGFTDEYEFVRDRGYESDMSDEDEDEDVIIPKDATPNPTPALSPHPAEGGSLEEQKFEDELKLELELELETQAAAEATAQREEAAQPPPLSDSSSSSLDAIATQQEILPVETPEQDHTNEVPTEHISEPFENSTESINDASDNHSENERGDNEPSPLDTSFEESNDSATSVEQSSPPSPPSPVEDDISDSVEKASNQLEAEIPLPEESGAKIEPYVGPDGHVGLPALDDTTDDTTDAAGASDDSDDSNDSDDEDTEMLESSPSEVIIADDTPKTEVTEDEDVTMLDADEKEIYQKYKVPAELANVVVEASSIDFEKLRADTIAARDDLDMMQEEIQTEIEISFDRAELLRDLGISEDRIANYMEVNRRYEPHTGPWPAKRVEVEVEIDSSDDESSDDEEYYEEDEKVKYCQGFQFKNSLPEPIDVPVTDPDAHPFGPI